MLFPVGYIIVATALFVQLRPTASLRCPMYKISADCYAVKREGQCDKIVCPCRTMKCESTEICTLQEVECFAAPCYPVAQCKPKSEVCPVYKLQANCYLKEVAGRCDEVVCPCETTTCSSTEVCTLQEVQCFAAPCYPVAECKPKSEVCPVYKLTADCYLKEVAGQCDEVVCPCQTTTCSSTEVCTLQEVQCFAAPCYPVAECKPKSEVCPVYRLTADCYSKEVAGQCDEAVCPCQWVKCAEGKVCHLQEVQCKTAPCYPEPTCECAPQDPCNIRCSTPLKTDENGCQLCECSEPTTDQP